MDDTLALRLAEIESAFDETEAALSDPETLTNPAMLAELGKRHADLRDVVSDIRRLRGLRADLEDARGHGGRPRHGSIWPVSWPARSPRSKLGSGWP